MSGASMASRLLGIILLGVFASSSPPTPPCRPGLIHGIGAFFGKELATGVGAAVYALVFTYVMLRVLDLITPVHVGTEEERGLDAAELGEAAYTFGPGSTSTGAA